MSPQVVTPQPPRRPRFPWPRSVRWRLTIAYVGVLALLLLVLGLALSLVLGRVIFDSDYQTFYDSAKSAVATNQRAFDLQVRGRALNTTCAGVPSYQDAF